MIKVWNKEKGLILCLAGVYIGEEKSCFDPKLELLGILATTGERISLGYYERKTLEGILHSIAKSLRYEDSIYVLNKCQD